MVQGNELWLGFWFLCLKEKRESRSEKNKKKSEQALCFVEISRVFSEILLLLVFAVLHVMTFA